MFDLNHIFLFIACVAPLSLLAQSWRKGGLNRAWRLAAFAVLVVTGVSWIWWPDTAGFVGGGAWLALLVLPATGLRKVSELAGQQRYAVARRIVNALRFLHPAGDLGAQSHLLQAMQFAQQGDSATALALLETLQNIQSSVGRQAIAQSFRIRGDWQGLLKWFRGGGLSGIVRADLASLPLYLRALGETGGREDLLVEFTAHAESINSAPQHQWLYDASLLIVLAFTGHVEALSNLRRLDRLSRDTREFWLGTGEIAAGNTIAGRKRLRELKATTTDALIRAETARRLERPLEFATDPVSPVTDALFQRMTKNDRPPARLFGASRSMPTPAVLFMISLNVSMFVAELLLGGSTNPDTLYRLGALDLFSVQVAGEYWRLVSSLFLHYGPLHLFFNLYALFVIGPGLEKAIGAIRFGVCYLLSGLGSGIGVLALHSIGLNRTEQLVGASGCIMGLVGVWAGLLLHHRDAPHAGRRLKNILLIVAIQTAFDLSTPQISMAAHMSGLVTGLFLGLALSPRTLPE